MGEAEAGLRPAAASALSVLGAMGAAAMNVPRALRLSIAVLSACSGASPATNPCPIADGGPPSWPASVDEPDAADGGGGGAEVDAESASDGGGRCQVMNVGKSVDELVCGPIGIGAARCVADAGSVPAVTFECAHHGFAIWSRNRPNFDDDVRCDSLETRSLTADGQTSQSACDTNRCALLHVPGCDARAYACSDSIALDPPRGACTPFGRWEIVTGAGTVSGPRWCCR